MAMYSTISKCCVVAAVSMFVSTTSYQWNAADINRKKLINSISNHSFQTLCIHWYTPAHQNPTGALWLQTFTEQTARYSRHTKCLERPPFWQRNIAVLFPTTDLNLFFKSPLLKLCCVVLTSISLSLSLSLSLSHTHTHTHRATVVLTSIQHTQPLLS
jgi:hypothetical protein